MIKKVDLSSDKDMPIIKDTYTREEVSWLIDNHLKSTQRYIGAEAFIVSLLSLRWFEFYKLKSLIHNYLINRKVENE